MSLVPIVEGLGEVEAVPVLLRRLCGAFNRWDVEVARPFRVKRNSVVKEGALENAIRVALADRKNPEAVIVILDADDDCAATLAPQLLERAEAASGGLPVAVVIAEREFESWFLAAKESLRGRCGIRDNAESPAEPERIRDAKGELSRNMEGSRRYVPVEDQPALAQVFDTDVAAARARSFDKLRREMERLLGAVTAA